MNSNYAYQNEDSFTIDASVFDSMPQANLNPHQESSFQHYPNYNAQFSSPSPAYASSEANTFAATSISSTFYDYSHNFNQGGATPKSQFAMQSTNASVYHSPSTTNQHFAKEDEEDELPLLQELGIDFDHIIKKTLYVLLPYRRNQPFNDPEVANDSDLAGPLIFCLLFGVSLMLRGKLQFGFIYGISALACFIMFTLLSLMSDRGVSLICIMSVLGYSLLPILILSLFSFFFSLRHSLGLIFVILCDVWSAYSASKLFVLALDMKGKQILVLYPCALLYGIFILLAVF